MQHHTKTKRQPIENQLIAFPHREPEKDLIPACPNCHVIFTTIILEHESQQRALVAEHFLRIMKSDLLYVEEFESPEAFMKALDEYIDYYKRIKSRLKGKSPVQYRTLYS